MRIPASDLLRPRRWAALWWLPLLPVAYGSLCWQLGEQPLQTWDEARLAVSAAELLRSHNWLVTTYQGQPDLWSTKPPLLLWLQALSLHTFGYSAWAFRLPTMLAALGLTALVAAFARRWLGGPLAGLLAGLALLTSKGFVAQHVARTGDYEALLLLFTTGQVLAAFAWLHTRRTGYLWALGAAVGLAVLTKGVAGLFLLPGLGLAVGQRRQLPALLRQPAAWGAALLALALPAVWYGAREQAGAGYLQAVWANELGGRMLGSLETHAAPWYWYLLAFVSQQFILWTPWLLAAGWALARRPAQRPARRFLALAGGAGGGLLLVISAAGTKLAWYAAPLYPLLALVLGAGLAALARRVGVGQRGGHWRSAGLLALAVLPSLLALHHRLARVQAQRYDEAELSYGHFLQLPAATPAAHLVAFHRSWRPNSRSYNPGLEFYALAWRTQHPTDTLDTRYEAAGLPPGRVVLVCGATARAALAQRYTTRLLYAADSCCTLQVLGPR